MKPNDYKPSHPHLFIVKFRPGDFNSSLQATKNFKAGESICGLGNITPAPQAWSTVQCGPKEHFELNSDLVYINHSCEPNVAFNISSPNRKQWYLMVLKDIDQGADLSFFYPSTEWEMGQPFDCFCGTKTCLKFVKGSAYLVKGALYARGYVSPHVRQLVEERDAREKRPTKL